MPPPAPCAPLWTSRRVSGTGSAWRRRTWPEPTSCRPRSPGRGSTRSSRRPRPPLGSARSECRMPGASLPRARLSASRRTRRSPASSLRWLRAEPRWPLRGPLPALWTPGLPSCRPVSFLVYNVVQGCDASAILFRAGTVGLRRIHQKMILSKTAHGSLKWQT